MDQVLPWEKFSRFEEKIWRYHMQLRHVGGETMTPLLLWQAVVTGGSERLCHVTITCPYVVILVSGFKERPRPFLSDPRPCRGHHVLEPRDPGDPATLPTLLRGNPEG